MVMKTYQYRIYPNKKQKELLTQTFGCVRYVYNYYLAKRKEIYQTKGETFNYYKCSKDLTQLKKEEDKRWLLEVDSIALQVALKNLDIAYDHFFKHINGFPSFKSKKDNYKSYLTKNNNNNIRYANKHIKLPKIGFVKTKDNLIPQGKILSAVVMQKPSGKYFVSLTCEKVDISPFLKTEKKIGVDLGLRFFATFSDGERIFHPKILEKSLLKLAKLQRNFARKQRGSHNREKARIKLAKFYEKITNQRKDFLHKLSKRLIRENDIICVENLSIREMMKTKPIALSIADASWGTFINFLEYKATFYGKTLVKIDKFFPSSQICNNCGFKSEDVKKLFLKEWICPKCGIFQDRDLNASINILNEGLKQLKTVGTTELAW